VAISGSTVLIGAPRDNKETGAAHVFTGSGSSWTWRTKLVAQDGADYDSFGTSVALSGGTALVGAHAEGDYQGAAYVFTGSGSSWTERRKLTAGDGAPGDFFGASVALSGGTALIGAYGHDMPSSTDQGAAYVFTGSGSSWTQRAKLQAGDGTAGDRFGFSVALSGGTALVGAHAEGDYQGAAYVFIGSGSSWTERATLRAAGGAAGDWFGYSVALSGGTALIGAYLHDTPPSTDQGAAYLHRFSSALIPGVTRIAGADRYLTALAASRRGFPIGAPAVVIATGENWPDALGGSALAGAAHGPLLLTRKGAIPAEVVAELKRLGAVKAYVLGSTDAVSLDVENALVALFGRTGVIRLGGTDRYETARLVADETIRLRGTTYGGTAFVATGLNYPDATAASPLAACLGVPILLANVRTGTVSLPLKVTDAVVLGSEAAVPKSVYDYLVARLTAAGVTRRGGANRYATAALVAEWGVGRSMQWNGVGLATGENFPDALAAGPMLATNESVLLLTRPTALPGETSAKLLANRASIASMFIFGDTNAVSVPVEAAAKAAAGL
jgi:putative cell wall-binding protein